MNGYIMYRCGFFRTGVCVVLLLAIALGSLLQQQAVAEWEVGTPLVTYWYRSSILTDSLAQEAVNGNFNTVWVAQYEGTQLPSLASQLAIAEQYGLRTMLWSSLITPATLDDPAKLAQLNALVDQYKQSPTAYSYYINDDEPHTSLFPGLGQLVDHLHGRDPDRMPFISIPSASQDMSLWGASSYDDYLNQYVSIVNPPLIASAYYGLYTTGDSSEYLHHMAKISKKAKSAGVPFLNTEQIFAFDPSFVVPTANQFNFLVYKDLAFGAQGISYWNYWTTAPNTGGIGGYGSSNPIPDATSEAVYAALTPLNKQFAAIAGQYQGMNWIDTYLKGYHPNYMPPGTTILPSNSPFDITSVANDLIFSGGEPVKGVLFGLFDQDGTTSNDATFALVQNLDYSASKAYIVNGPGDLSVFNATTGVWTAMGSNQVTLNLDPGVGAFVGLTSLLVPPPPPQVDLVGHWTFDEGSGTTAFDSSGKGYDGTISGATYTTGKIGSGALQFDGTAHVEVPGYDDLLLTYTDYTIAFWVKPDYSGDQDLLQVYVGTNDQTDYVGGYSIVNASYGDDAIAQVNTASGGESLPFSRPSGDVWTHIAMTFDGTTRTIYIDGVEDASMASNPIGYDGGTGDPLWFGALFGYDWYHFKGLMDDIQIYRQALTATEVGTVFAGGVITSPGFGDANNDGKVDDVDATIMAINWQRTDANWAMGDFNSDGTVNHLDAAILAENWLSGLGGSTASVPEPHSLILLLSSLVMLFALLK